jgi:CRP-like cAMP-binding protein
MFAECGNAELTEIDSHIDEVHVDTGSLLAREGEVARQSFVIMSGTAETYVNGRAIAQLGPGDFFGETNVLAGGAWPTTVVASSPMRLLVVPPQYLRHFLTIGAVASTVIGEISRRLQKVEPIYYRTLADEKPLVHPKGALAVN